MKLLPVLLASSLALVSSSALAQFTQGRVVVLQCDGTATTGNSGSLLEYLPATANQASPTYQVALPNSGTTPTTTSIVFGQNSAFNHGLSLSSDGALVVVNGYANMLAASAVDSTTIASGGANRVIATVRYDGVYARPVTTTAYNGQTFRHAASDGYGNFWGINGSSVQYFFNGTATQVQTAAGRCIGLTDGSLYYTLAASVRTYGGAPTTPTASFQVIANHSASATGFGIPSNPVVGSRAYVGDVNAAPGVIGRYDWDGGSWVWQYDIPLPGTDKPQWLTVDYSGANPVIFSSTAGSKLYATTDVGPAAGNATTIVLATAPAGKIFRGVALSPRQPVAPVFTVHPSNVSDSYGATVSFGPVDATGANPNAYTWKKGSVTITNGGNISGANTATLTITGISSADAGTYFAVASNNGGSVTSTGATLSLAGSSITTQLVSRTNAVGTTATFHVVSAGTPPLSYAWFLNNSPLSDGTTFTGSVISGATTSTLTISGVQEGDAGNYTVTVTDNNSVQSSSTASLTVVTPPFVDIQPVNQNKAAGANATFSVQAFGGSLSYNWYRGATLLTNGPSGSGATISGATTQTITITGVQDGDVGNYTVVVTNVAGTVTSDIATLTVGHIPAFAPGPKNSTNAPGSTATFTSAVTGSPTLSYVWKHNGNAIFNDGFHIFGADTSNLSIVGVDLADAGTYSLTVTNSYGNVTSNVVLFAVYGQPEPNTTPGLIVYEKFNYPVQPYSGFPAPTGWINSWDSLISTYNHVTGQPAYWLRTGGPYCTIEAGYLRDSTRSTSGQYPWPGIECNSDNQWYWSSAGNNNHLKFGGVAQTNGAAYFSCILQIDQGSALNQGVFDVIAGFSSGDSLAAGANADSWNYKLCTQADGSGGDGYYLGVFKGGGSTINGSSANGQWALGKHSGRGAIHFVVGCYKFGSGTNLVGGSVTNDDIVTLWIDPPRSSFGASELNRPTPDAGGMLTNWNSNATITEFGLRGTVPPASKRITDLRIGTSWASVTQPHYPVLNMAATPSDATFSWNTKDSGYVLQRSTDVGAPTWLNVDPPYALDGTGTNNTVTLTPSPTEFFRLFYPPR